MMENVKVSVIVPVYNAEKYVGRCIQSLLDQTLREIEVIVVDDKGKDASIQVVKDLVLSSSRSDIFIFLEMERNSGAAAARNFGISHARGEYVAFLDCDDWCEPQMYESLYQSAKEKDADWCYTYGVKDYPDGRKSAMKEPFSGSGVLDSSTRRAMLTSFVSYFTLGVYKRSFLAKHNLSFPNYRFSEDSFFFWNVVLRAKNFSCVEKEFYHYVIQPGSVTNQTSDVKALQKVDLYEKFVEMQKIDAIYNEYKEEIDFMFIKKGYLIPMVINAINKQSPSKNNPIFEALRRTVPDYKKNLYFGKSLKLRCLDFLLVHCFTLSRWAVRLFARNKEASF